MVSRSRSTFGLSSRGGDRLVVEHLQDGVQRRLGLERRPAGQQLVEDGAQAVDVAGQAQVRLSGRRPARGPCSWACRGSAPVRVWPGVAVEPLGQAEVGDVRLVVGVEQDVGRLEVAVQDAVVVGVVDWPGRCWRT